MTGYASFKYNPAEVPPDDLARLVVGRDALLDHLVRAVREQSERDTIQHYLLLGPRGVGKTTLLLLLERRIRQDRELSKRWLVVRYAEEEFYVYTLRDLLGLTLDYLAESGEVPEARESLEQADAEKDDELSLALIKDALKRICESRGKRVLLLIDNLDGLFPKDVKTDNGQHALRKLLSTEPYLMVVATSVQLVEDIAQYDEAFYNFFSTIDVENLSEEGILRLLEERARFDHNEAFLSAHAGQREKVLAITFLTGGNPRLVLMLYDILSKRELLPVVRTLWETLDNLTPLLKDVLEDLPGQRGKVFDSLMRLGGVASPSAVAEDARLALNAVTTQLGRLKEARMVDVEGEGRGKPARYYVRDAMFRTWYQMRYLRPARRRIEIFVDVLRAWFSTEERKTFLGELHTQFEQHLLEGVGARAREVLCNIEYLAATLDDDSGRSEELSRLVTEWLQLGDIHTAADLCPDAYGRPTLTEKQRKALGYTLVANELFMNDKFEEALAACRTGLKFAPSSVNFNFILCECLLLMEKWKEARDKLTQLLDAQVNAENYTWILSNRAESNYNLGEYTNAVKDLDALLELKKISVPIIADTLFMRGAAKSQLNDTQGAIADYSAVVELPDAPTDAVARALLARVFERTKLLVEQGTVEDLTRIVTMEDAPTAIAAQAFFVRAIFKSFLDDQHGAIEDYTAAAALVGAPSFAVGQALIGRSAAKATVGDLQEALADLARGITISPNESLICHALSEVLPALEHAGRHAEALDWASRLNTSSGEKLNLEKRVEGRINILVAVASKCSIAFARKVLDAFLENADAELKQRLEFLQPGLEFAQSGDESVLTDLPREEQEFARRIADRIAKNAQDAVTALPPLSLSAAPSR